MPGKIILEVVSGKFQGRSFEFDAHDAFLFGRHSHCHVHLPRDPLVSRNHFLLEVNPPDARLRDLGSLNGTFVNQVKCGGREPHEDSAGRQYPEVDLQDGDRITVGSNTIRVCVEIPASAASTVDCRSPTALEKLLCQRCGKDVAAEVHNRRGEYLCEACRGVLLADDNQLRQLLQQAAEQARDQALLSVDGYEIVRLLGRGGMGMVYLARSKRDSQLVALKLMLPRVAVDEEARRLFLREIDVTRQLRHPNIASLLETGAAHSMFYFIMEYCSGGSLEQFQRQQGGRLPPDLALPLLVDCLRGLEHAHRLKVVHRDLKPGNILLEAVAGRMTAKIADFGLAKCFERAGLSGMTATGICRGTYAFMPREQLTEFKYIQATSDIWSIAATFYHVLTGAFPRDFTPQRDPVEVILNDDCVPIRRRDPAIPAPIAALFDRALKTDPAQRFADASEMRSAVESLV